MNAIPLSIVLPCYNPTTGWLENIESCITKIRRDIGLVELIIVNDGSTDRSVIVATENRHGNVGFINCTYNVNKGKGYALREGVKLAKGEVIIYTDIDFPYTYESLLHIYQTLQEKKTDVAIGIRSEDYYMHLPKARVRISKLLRWFIKKFLRIPTDDTQCGLKGFNQKGKEVFLQTTINRYLFDLEFVFLSARKKLNIKTIEVELRPEVVLSKMNWKILTQEFGNFLKIFFNSIFATG